MVFAVAVGRVDAGFLQRVLHSFADLLFLGLLNGDLALFLNHLGRAVFRRNGDRVHGHDLDGDTFGEFLIDRLVESDDRAELTVGGVDIGSHIGSFEFAVESERVFLTALAGLLGNGVFHRFAIGHPGSLEGFEVGRASGDGGIGDGVGQGLEFSVLGDEVGLAAKAYENTFAVCHAGLHGTFGGLTVRTFGGHEFAFLTDNLLGTVEVAFSLYEGFLAVHHTGTRHLAQFCDIKGFDFHRVTV